MAMLSSISYDLTTCGLDVSAEIEDGESGRRQKLFTIPFKDLIEATKVPAKPVITAQAQLQRHCAASTVNPIAPSQPCQILQHEPVSIRRAPGYSSRKKLSLKERLNDLRYRMRAIDAARGFESRWLPVEVVIKEEDDASNASGPILTDPRSASRAVENLGESSDDDNQRIACGQRLIDATYCRKSARVPKGELPRCLSHGGGYDCSVETCGVKVAYENGVCESHGQRCQRSGCMRYVATSTHCGRHSTNGGKMTQCARAGCGVLVRESYRYLTVTSSGRERYVCAKHIQTNQV